MPANITVTGVAGPAGAVTAVLLSNNQSFTIGTDPTGGKYLEYVKADGTTAPKIAIDSATTITCTVSGSVFTLTIS